VAFVNVPEASVAETRQSTAKEFVEMGTHLISVQPAGVEAHVALPDRHAPATCKPFVLPALSVKLVVPVPVPSLLMAAFVRAVRQSRRIMSQKKISTAYRLLILFVEYEFAEVIERH
jgi:hypothetical protein